MVFAVLRLSFITAYLSDQVVAGFTAGAAIHVGTSQISSLFNMKNPSFGGRYALYYIYKEIIVNIFAGKVFWIFFLILLYVFFFKEIQILCLGQLHNSRDVAVHCNRDDHRQGGDQSTPQAKTQRRADSV
jgi:MFS superfamily sulfate permease-like transporter